MVSSVAVMPSQERRRCGAAGMNGPRLVLEPMVMAHPPWQLQQVSGILVWVQVIGGRDNVVFACSREVMFAVCV